MAFANAYSARINTRTVTVGPRVPTEFLVTTDDGSNYTSYLTEVTGAGHAALDGLDTVANGDWFVIRCPDANVRGVYLAMEGAEVNGTASVLTVEFWDGSAWTAVSNLSDGTSSGGATLAQTGLVGFSYPGSTWAENTIDGASGYHLRFSVSAAVDSPTSIDTATVFGRVQIVDRDDATWGQLAKAQAYFFRNTHASTNIYVGGSDVLPGDVAQEGGGWPLYATSKEGMAWDRQGFPAGNWYADFASDAAGTESVVVAVIRV